MECARTEFRSEWASGDKLTLTLELSVDRRLLLLVLRGQCLLATLQIGGLEVEFFLMLSAKPVFDFDIDFQFSGSKHI